MNDNKYCKKEQGRQLAQRMGADYIECSPFNGRVGDVLPAAGGKKKGCVAF